MPAGSFAGSRAAFATSKRSRRRSVPGTLNTPSAKTTSCADDFQKVRGELRALVDDGASRLVERRAADGKRARAAGQPGRRAVGVAHDHVDAVGIDAELVRDELLVCGDEAGAVFLVAHDQLDARRP